MIEAMIKSGNGPGLEILQNGLGLALRNQTQVMTQGWGQVGQLSPQAVLVFDALKFRPDRFAAELGRQHVRQQRIRRQIKDKPLAFTRR